MITVATEKERASDDSSETDSRAMADKDMGRCFARIIRTRRRKRGRVMEYCEWAVREGWGNSYWGSTPCKKGFNYLSKTNKVSQLKDCYESRLCPICGKPIKLKGYVFDDDFVEQW